MARCTQCECEMFGWFDELCSDCAFFPNGSVRTVFEAEHLNRKMEKQKLKVKQLLRGNEPAT